MKIQSLKPISFLTSYGSIKILASLVVVIYYLTWFIGSFFETTSFLVVVQFLFGSLALLFLNKESNINYKLIILFISMYVLAMISSITNNNYNFIGVTHNMHFIFISVILLNSKLSTKILSLSFYTTVLIFTCFIFANSDPNNIFAYSSRNYVSVAMILQVSLLYISYFKNGLKIPLTPSIMTLIISLWGVGRSGIFSSFIILVGVVTHKLIKERINHKFLFITFISLFSFLLFLYHQYPSIFENIGDSLLRFQSLKISEDGRAVILQEYLLNIDTIGAFIFGITLDDIPILVSRFNFNLHNSYLRLHSIYGLVGVFIVLFGIIKGYFTQLKNGQVLYFFIFSAILFRIMTDTIAFPGIMDSLIVYFIFQTDFDNFIDKNKTLILN